MKVYALTLTLLGCGTIAPTPDAATTLLQDASDAQDVTDAQPQDQSSPDGTLDASDAGPCVFLPARFGCECPNDGGFIPQCEPGCPAYPFVCDGGP